MKLATRLETRLNRLFALSACMGLVVLLVHSYFSAKQIKDRAGEFISSHVKQISQAEVNAQNVSEIDREVRRVYEAWRSTQDIDIRVDILIDGKLVGHAGQNQEFDFWSQKTVRRFDLSSGQKLTVEVQLDLWPQFISDILMIAVISGFLLLGYALMRAGLRRQIREMTRPLEQRVEWIHSAASDLPASLTKNNFPDSHIDELTTLDRSLEAFANQIRDFEVKVAKSNFAEGRIKMAEQLAHNLKGSLATLSLRIQNSSMETADKRRLVSVVQDISQIGRDLLTSGRASPQSEIQVLNVISKIVGEKQDIIHREKSIDFSIETDGSTPKLLGVEQDFATVIGSLIDNSVDAITTGGRITLTVSSTDMNCHIQIADDGKGIPSDILPLLFGERATFGKPEGIGLGLFHAKKVIGAMGGAISIDSRGVGTVVSISVPLAGAKSAPTIHIRRNQTVVIADDDPLIHQGWIMALKGSAINRVLIHNPSEFAEWMQKNGSGEFGDRIYLMDYDFKAETTGLDLIKKYHIGPESILFTGHVGPSKIGSSLGDECRKLGAQFISKDQFPKLIFENPEVCHKSELAEANS